MMNMNILFGAGKTHSGTNVVYEAVNGSVLMLFFPCQSLEILLQ